MKIFNLTVASLWFLTGFLFLGQGELLMGSLGLIPATLHLLIGMHISQTENIKGL